MMIPEGEAKEAVRICMQAGIRPIMITGDHRGHGHCHCPELNIIRDESEVITGSELTRSLLQILKKQ
jgi:Ca2+-transporting ATPase